MMERQEVRGDASCGEAGDTEKREREGGKKGDKTTTGGSQECTRRP
jgi:hypothetical protein